MMRQNKRLQNRMGYFSMAAGIILIAAAVILLLHNYNEDRQAGTGAQSILNTMKSTISDSGESAGTAKEAEIEGCGYLGYLTIPALDLQLPVMSEWDDSRLAIAPCRYTGSVQTDDLVICGHNYTSHFGRLKNLNAGDSVIFTDINGNKTAYKVVRQEILQPTEITAMIDSAYDLTLYTCTYGGKSRVTIRCDRILRQ